MTEVVQAKTYRSPVSYLTPRQVPGVLGKAAKRISHEASRREGNYLRPLDTYGKSRGRTRQEVWNNLLAISEPLLARLDLKTLTLGYYDLDSGTFRLNSQRGLAEDSGIPEYTLSRTLRILEKVGYLKRCIKRIKKDGGWITRVTVSMCHAFFAHLGLSYQLYKARMSKVDRSCPLACQSVEPKSESSRKRAFRRRTPSPAITSVRPPTSSAYSRPAEAEDDPLVTRIKNRDPAYVAAYEARKAKFWSDRRPNNKNP